MSRGCVFAVLVALASSPGCGLGMRKLADAPGFFVYSESITHKEPAHRVALATLEAMRLELAKSDFADGQASKFSYANELFQGDMKVPKPGELLPANYPAFWVDWTAEDDGRRESQLVILLEVHFEGRTLDGRAVEVTVTRSQETVVTIRVGRHGDAKASKKLGDRIDDRLAHPLHPPGSLEEADTLRAFFGGVESREAIPTLKKAASAGPG